MRHPKTQQSQALHQISPVLLLRQWEQINRWPGVAYADQKKRQSSSKGFQVTLSRAQSPRITILPTCVDIWGTGVQDILVPKF